MNRTLCPRNVRCGLFMRNQCLFHEYMIFVLVHPTVIRGVIIQFGMDGRDESAPTPTECTLLLFMYNQCLFHVYTIFVPTSRCGLSSYTNIYPRTPTVMRDCIYTIRCGRAR
ncbi:hypothetical protein [Prevotella pallens]|uniref:hypothetical protein n=1 Tax=Prevotella pallens TaxID=60133 RepID=UPI001CAB6312|nr:hypothetical protein [Prevotella pallens]MBF1451104.1 hypothetical protein [Prevotella pallens]